MIAEEDKQSSSKLWTHWRSHRIPNGHCPQDRTGRRIDVLSNWHLCGCSVHVVAVLTAGNVVRRARSVCPQVLSCWARCSWTMASWTSTAPTSPAVWLCSFAFSLRGSHGYRLLHGDFSRGSSFQGPDLPFPLSPLWSLLRLWHVHLPVLGVTLHGLVPR